MVNAMDFIENARSTQAKDAPVLASAPAEEAQEIEEIVESVEVIEIIESPEKEAVIAPIETEEVIEEIDEVVEEVTEIEEEKIIIEIPDDISEPEFSAPKSVLAKNFHDLTEVHPYFDSIMHFVDR